MSRTIDEKVVSLEFDNEKFEKNVKTSLSTIEKLKQALKFDGATKGMEEVERASEKMNFENVSSSIEKVSVKFNVLQTAAVAAVTNITNKIVDMGLQLVQSLSGFNMIKTGYAKMDELNSSVQTLVNSTGKSTDEIMRLLNRLNVFSDETSYGLNDMVSALSTMVASGGDIETLIPMIEGVANATAYAGKTASEFTRVMFNLTQSYSAGFLKYEDWKSVMLAGVNTKDLVESLIRAGEELGRIKEGTVTVANFTETLKTKWADLEVMEKAFSEDFGSVTQLAHEMVESGEVETFTEAYKILAEQGLDPLSVKAAQAAQEAKTFKEVMDATTDAVSSKWMQMFATLIGNYDEAKKTWSQLAEDFYYIFADPLDQILNNVIKPAFMSRWDQFEEKIEETGLTAAKFEEELLKYDEANGGALSRLIDKYGSLKAAMSSGFVPSAFIVKFLDYLTSGSQVIGEATSKLEAFQKVFNDVWSGKYGNGEERIKKLTEAGYNYATVQGLINKLAKEGHRSGYGLTVKDIEDLDDAMLTNLGLTKEEIAQLRELAEQAKDSNTEIYELIHTLGDADGPELFRNILGNLTGTILNLQETAREAWDEVMDVDFAGILYRIVKSVSDFTDKIRELTTESSVIKNAFKLLYSGLKAVFSVFNLIKTVAGQIARGAFSIIGKILKELNIEIPEFTANLTSGIDNLVAWITDNDTIFNALDRIGDAIAGFIPTIKDWIKAFTELPFIQNAIQTFRDVLQDITNKELDFSKITDPIMDLKESIMNGTFNPLETLGIGIAGLFGGLTTTISEYAGSAKDSLQKMLSPLKLTDEELSKVGKIFTKGGETLLGFGTGYMFMTVLNNIASALSKFVKPFTALSDVAESAKGSFNAVTSYIQSLGRTTNVNNILKLAIAMGILVGAFWLLAKLDWQSLVLAGATIAGLMFAIKSLNDSLAAKDITAIKKSELPKVLLSMAASLLIVAIAMKKLDSLKNGFTTIGYLAAAIIGLSGAMWFLNSKAGGVGLTFTDFTKPLLAFAASLFLIAIALKKLESVHITSETVGTLGIISLALIALSKVAQGLGNKQGYQIVGIAASLYIFAKILEKISEVSFEDAYNGMIKLLPVVILLGLIMAATNGINGSSYTAAALVAAAGAAVFLMGRSVEKLGSLDPDVLHRGGKASVMLFGVISLIGAGLAKLLGSTSMIMFSFGKAVGMAAMMITACGSLYLMAGAVMIFKNMDRDGLIQGAGTVAALLLALGFSMGLMALGSKGINYQTVAAIGRMAVIIGVLGGVVMLISTIKDTKKILAIVGGLVAVIVALGGLMWAISKWGFEVKTAWQDLIGITAVLALAGGAIYLLAAFTETDRAIEAATALSELIVALSAAFMMISVSNKIAKVAMNEIPTIATVLLAIAGIATIVGSVAAALGEDVMNGVVTGATQAGEMIGGFIGGIIGGLGGGALEGLTTTLPQIGNNLSEFKENIESFMHFQVPETFGGTLQSLIEMFEGLGNSQMQTYLKNIKNNQQYTESLKSFLVDYANAVVAFSFEIQKNGGIDSAAVEAAAKAGQMLAQLSSNLPNTGLFASIFNGTMTLSEFGAHMESFARSLVITGASLKYGGFDMTMVTAATNAGKMIVSLCDSLPGTGILDVFFTGKMTLSEFGAHMEAFVRSLLGVSATLSYGQFDSSVVTKAANAGKVMAELAQALPEDTSLKSILMGSPQDLSNFSAGMLIFAGCIKDFCSELDGATIDLDIVDKAKEAGVRLAELASALPEGGGLFSSAQTLGSFGGDLTLFANGIKSFFDTLGADTLPPPEEMESITESAKNLITMSKDVGSESWHSNIGSNISNGLGTLGQTVKDLYTSIISFDPSQYEDTYGVWDYIRDKFSEEATEEAAEQSHQSGMQIYESHITGFEDEELQDYQKEVLNTVGRNNIDFLNKPYNDGETLYELAMIIGEDFLKGFLKGVENAGVIGAIQAAVNEVGTGATMALRASVSVNSPSRETMKIGRYFDEGLIIGIKSLSQNIEDSAFDAGISMLTGISQSIALANSVLEDDMNPVITPVLDLSNIRTDAGQISGLLGPGSSYSTAMSIGGYGWNSGIQNGGLNGQPIVMTNNFTLNGVGNIQDPSVLNNLADKLADKINIILGNAL